VTLRPKWSKFAGSTTAWRRRARLLSAAALLGGCSGLDPNIGPWRIERESDVASADADVPETGAQEEGGQVNPGEVSFARDIRPLMNRPGKGDPTGRGCKSCHYHTEASHNGIDLSGLDLGTLGLLRQGGGSSGRRIVVAGKPAESVILQSLLGRYAYSNRMPKGGSPYWSDNEIQLVRQWITEGAKGANDE
jgi:hypothetical protein